MPTYVYKFLETGETIEVQQSFDDPVLTEAAHPVTGATMAVKKVFLPVGVTFKGGGFYKTDSRSGSASKAGSSKSESSKSESSKSESSKSESSKSGSSESSKSESSKSGGSSSPSASGASD